MGLMRWLFGLGGGSSPAVLRGDGTFPLAVVGEASYQGELEGICGPRTDESVDLEVEALLVAEPDNPQDRHAVKVTIAGQTVGYLSRADARAFGSRYLSGSSAVRCMALVRGGWDREDRGRGHYGVYLDVPQP